MKTKYLIILNCVYAAVVALQETGTIDILPLDQELKTSIKTFLLGTISILNLYGIGSNYLKK